MIKQLKIYEVTSMNTEMRFDFRVMTLNGIYGTFQKAFSIWITVSEPGPNW